MSSTYSAMSPSQGHRSHLHCESLGFQPNYSHQPLPARSGRLKRTGIALQESHTYKCYNVFGAFDEIGNRSQRPWPRQLFPRPRICLAIVTPANTMIRRTGSVRQSSMRHAQCRCSQLPVCHIYTATRRLELRPSLRTANGKPDCMRGSTAAPPLPHMCCTARCA